jgi:hypothetical protein
VVGFVGVGVSHEYWEERRWIQVRRKDGRGRGCPRSRDVIGVVESGRM